MTLVSGGIRFVRIFAEVPRGGGVKVQTTVGLSTMVIFSVFAGYFSDTLEMSVIVWRYAVRRRLFNDPKMHDLE